MRTLLSVFLLLTAAATPLAAQKPKFTVGWSIYVGWNPYGYMEKSGILKKWADKYGIDIKVQRFDYAPSLDAFVAKNIDACTMTNMEALDMPAAAGIDTTSIITGDFSNGNDAILVRNGLTLAALPGKKVMLVEKTVSQYLFERAMTMNGLKDQTKRVTLINTSDSDIATAFIANPSQPAVVTWKPMVSQIMKTKGVTSVFDSSRIPGEILDLLVVRTDILKKPEGQKFAKAITGAWYEVLSQMKSDKVLKGIADTAQDSLPSYKEQLTTTNLFVTPQSALDFMKPENVKPKMDLVRRFCFEHHLLGDAKAADDVAIQYPDGTIQGKPARVRFHFDNTYMQMAAQGKL